MINPVFDIEDNSKNTGKIIPIYPLTYSLSQNGIRNAIENGLKIVSGKLDETMPEYLLKEYHLEGLNEAIKQIHFPDNFQEYKKLEIDLYLKNCLVCN